MKNLIIFLCFLGCTVSCKKNVPPQISVDKTMQSDLLFHYNSSLNDTFLYLPYNTGFDSMFMAVIEFKIPSTFAAEQNFLSVIKSDEGVEYNFRVKDNTLFCCRNNEKLDAPLIMGNTNKMKYIFDKKLQTHSLYINDTLITKNSAIDLSKQMIRYASGVYLGFDANHHYENKTVNVIDIKLYED